MNLLLILFLAVCPLLVDYAIAGNVYTVHDYRRVNVDSKTAVVRRIGNTYVFPRYRASSTSSVLLCSYGGYSRVCCAGWSRNNDGTCSPICTMNCIHGSCIGPDRCKCDKGYAGKRCDRDLNECGLEPRPCDHRCTNTQGSYKCFCQRGFVLQEDGRGCERDERCYPGRCSHSCGIQGNDIVCICPAGLRLISDGYHCKDIDECAEGLVKCPDDQVCRNTFGNYLCVCQEGREFQLINGRYQCAEIGCQSLPYECHEHAHCGFVDLLAECICNIGHWGNGRMCLPAEIRDCSDSPCYPGVICTNEFEDIREISGYPPGGIFDQYRCGICPNGYEGDGIHCTDLNECESNSHRCHENAECINEPGSHRCECLEGFHGNGEICVLVSELGCEECFPEVPCNAVPPPDPNDIETLSVTDIIYLFLCGPCPTGFEGDGFVCDDIDECASGTDDCSMNSICVNDEGSYHCECKDGYHGNGDVCVLISMITCDDFPCFVESVCVNVPLPDDNDEEALLLMDIIVLYQCGPCPSGYIGDGEMCEDLNECEAEPPATNCSPNADCENIPGSYMCNCSKGYLGNGQYCILLDRVDCEDSPCSPEVNCTDLNLNELDISEVDFTLPVLEQFKCGPCPDAWVGDGYNCKKIPGNITIPEFVNLTVIVLARTSLDIDPLFSMALVRLFTSDPFSQSGTRQYGQPSRTGGDGIAVVPCPHNESVIVTINPRNANLFANSVTFRCNFDQTNVVTIPLHTPYEDTSYKYHPQSPRQFGVGNETLNERYSTFFPEDSFDIPDERRLRHLFRSVNVSVPEELEKAPEMIACVPQPDLNSGRGDVGSPSHRVGDIDIRAIEAFGTVELTVIDIVRKKAPVFKFDKKMTMSFPIQKLPSDLDIGDKIPAWYYDYRNGCWIEDGEGELVSDERTGHTLWLYQANHFTWWAAGRVNSETSCVQVRTCYDAACNELAPDTLLGIFGKDYGYETFRYTNVRGQTCIQFPFERTVEIFSPCTGATVEVISTVNPSSCSETANEIPRVPSSQTFGVQDECRQITLVIPEYTRNCENPAQNLDGGLFLESISPNAGGLSYGTASHYECSNPQSSPGEGEGYRVCDRCFSWTGNLQCEEADTSY